MSDATDLRVVIVDDEEPARRLLRELLGEIGGVRVVAECANGFEAVKVLGRGEADAERPDLLLLDVQMPKLDGFEVLELLGDDAPHVIFVTAYDEYALRAFEVHAVDYLLKPVDDERLADALEQARVRLRAEGPPGSDPVTGGAEEEGDRTDATALRRAARPEATHLERVLVRDGGDIHVLRAEEIDYVEAQDDYVMLVAGTRRLRKPERLTNLEKGLDPGRFVRIHRSYLLNVERLAQLELYAKDSRIAILHDGSKLPVSRSGYARLRERL